MKTWKIEACVVAFVLFVQLFFTHFNLPEIICSLAVFFTFLHAQVADRMQERQAILEKPDVECYWKSNWFFGIKEFLWIVFFLMIHSYAALSGAILFSIYPFWRKYWRKIKPLKTHYSSRAIGTLDKDGKISDIEILGKDKIMTKHNTD